MKHIVELVKWDGCGTGKAEELAKELANGIGFNKTSAYYIDFLLKLKKIPLRTIPDADFYVYYNYHPSSGYETILYINDDNEIAYKAENRGGWGLCAMWNEIIVFTIQDKRY